MYCIKYNFLSNDFFVQSDYFIANRRRQKIQFTERIELHATKRLRIEKFHSNLNRVQMNISVN